MAILKQSTAFTRMFLMVDSTDHVTGKTGLSSPDSITLTISKAGGSFSAVGGAIAEVANGWYKVSLTTTDTNTLGDLAFHATASGCDPTDWCDQVTAQILGDTLTANATQINSVSTSSVTTVNANVGTTQPVNFTGTGASALAKSDMVDIAGAAVSTSTAQLGVNVVNFGGSAGTFAGGRPEVNTTHIAGSAVSTSSAQIGVNVVNAGGTAWASGSLTSGVFASGAITAASIATDAIGAAELATDAVSEIAAAVWDLDATAHQTQGTFGQVLGDSGADTDSVWSLANTNLDATVSSRLATSGYTSPPSASTIAGAVWDEDATSHQTQGTFGQAIGDPGADTDTIFGLVNTNLDATVSSRLATSGYTAPDNASITGIKAKTDNLPSDPADESLIIAATDAISTSIAALPTTTTVNAIKAKTDNLPASPAATGDAMTLTSAYDFSKGTVAMTESYAANGVAPTPIQAVLGIHQYLMDFAISSTNYTVKKLDNSTTAFTVTLDSSTAPTSASRT